MTERSPAAIPRRVTIKDVARAAGVDPSTVTRALQGSERVRQKTREKIVAIAKDMDYVPNQAARTLVTQRSHLIGLVIPDLTNPFFADLSRGIDTEAKQHGLNVLIRNTDGNRQVEQAAIRLFVEMKVDGIIAPASRCSRKFYQSVPSSVPIVHVNRDDTEHHVCCDREAGTRAMVEHLIALGHRRIAFVKGPGPAAAAKYEGYRSVMAANFLPHGDELLLRFSGQLEHAAVLARRVLRLEPRPTAVFAWNDLCALGMMHALGQAGVRVPEDISIAGHDDVAVAAISNPALTTVHWPMFELGRASVTYLQRLGSGETPSRVSVPAPTLTVRDSTGQVEQ